MHLRSGYHDVPKGHLATIVTQLEMPAKPQRAFVPADMLRIEQPGVAWYRDLFFSIGSDWLWVSRGAMADAELAEIIHDPLVEVWVLPPETTPGGLVELDFRTPGQCELLFFGLAPGQIGQGLGRAMMDFAITRAFARDITLFHVHTCTLDSPQALPFYRRAGFVPVSQKVEVFEDPRLTGALPRDKGPHVPVIG